MKIYPPLRSNCQSGACYANDSQVQNTYSMKLHITLIQKINISLSYNFYTGVIVL